MRLMCREVLRDEMRMYDAVVLAPGPGNPVNENVSLFLVALELMRKGYRRFEACPEGSRKAGSRRMFGISSHGILLRGVGKLFKVSLTWFNA